MSELPDSAPEEPAEWIREREDFFGCPDFGIPGFWEIPPTLGGRFMRIMRCVAAGDAGALERVLAAGWPGPGAFPVAPQPVEKYLGFILTSRLRRPPDPGFARDSNPAETPIPPCTNSWIHFFSPVPYSYRFDLCRLSCAHMLWKPLHEACAQNRLDFAELLLKAGAFPDFGGKDSDNPITMAVLRKNTPLADLLLRYGASPRSGDYKFEPIILAIQQKNPPLVRRLCEALPPGDPLPWRNGHGALQAAYASESPEIIECILSRSGQNELDDAFVTALSYPSNSTETLLRLLDLGGSPDQALLSTISAAWIDDEEGPEAMALHRERTLRHVDLLLARGANPNFTDDRERPALLLAAENCPFPEVFERLVAAGADVHALNDAGENLLRCVACSDFSHPEVFRYVVSLGFSAAPLAEDSSWLETIKGRVSSCIPLCVANWTPAQWDHLFARHHATICEEYPDDALANPSLPDHFRSALLAAQAG